MKLCCAFLYQGTSLQVLPGREAKILTRSSAPFFFSRPTADSRTKLLADINRICENARVSIRSARHSAQKQIKKDVDGKVVGKSEGDKEMKKMDEEAKSRQKEVEDLNASMKKKLESED